MKKATNKVEALPYIDEDILFLILKLIDFPHGKKNVIPFQELKGQQDDDSYLKMIRALFQIKNQYGGIEVQDPTFNPGLLGVTLEEGMKILNKYIKQCKLFASVAEYSSLRKVLFNEFSGNDIETIATSSVFDMSNIFRCLDFKIKIGKPCQDILSRYLKNNTKNFVNKCLANDDGNFYTFVKHKRVGFKFIQERVEEFGQELRLEKSDFKNHFRFVDFIVAMHDLKYLEIISLSTTEKSGLTFKVKIKEKLLDEEKSHRKNQDAKKEIHALSTPPRTAWEDIEIKFVNDYEIEIYASKKFIEKISYERLACVNSKNKNPDIQWKLLQKFSVSKGSYSINQCRDIKEREKMRQQKGKLSRRLKKLFGIDAYDPIYLHSETQCYIARFKIQPEPNLRGSGELWR